MGGRPLAIDLFAGAGGLSLGFEQAGFDVLAAVEYDPVHAATHRFNFPNAPVLCRDVTWLSSAEVLAVARESFGARYPDREWPGTVDAVIGGPPCQGFSMGGKRLVDDERNNLLLHFVRLVVEIRPRSFCLENVSGLLDPAYDGLLRLALQQLERAGYHVRGTESAVNSKDFGVPQSRRRVLIRGGLEGVPEALAEVADPVHVSDALDGLPDPTAYEELYDSDKVRISHEDRSARVKAGSMYARVLTGLEVDPSDLSAPRIWDASWLTNSRLTRHRDDVVERFRATAPRTAEPRSRLYRLALDGPARTLRAGTGSERGAHTSPRPIHPNGTRVITVREAARLHGYPDWFRFHTTNWHGHRQVGNSVPPPLARAAASSLLPLLGVPSKSRSVVEPREEWLLALSKTRAAALFDARSAEIPAARGRAIQSSP